MRVLDRCSAAAALFAVSCLTVLADPLPFKTVDRGQYSHIERPRQVVVRSAADWAMLAKQHGRGGPQPSIDFAHTMVVGVFLGTRPTGGYGVEITRIERQGADLVVTWRERKPGADEMSAQVITAPYHLVTVEKFDGVVRFTLGT